jgi:hypothetical protein
VAVDLSFCFRKSGMMLQKEEILSLKKEVRLYFRGSSILYRQSLDSSVRGNDGWGVATVVLKIHHHIF